MNRPWGLSEYRRPISPVSRLARMSLARAVLSIVLSVAFLGQAVAGETKIQTLSLAPIPEEATIEIRLPIEEGSDDLKLSVFLADHFSVLLTDLGYTTVEADGELVFRFAAEEPTYAHWDGGARHLSLALGRSQPDGLPPGYHRVSRASPAALSESDEDTYRLRVSVARASKPPLWTGYIERSVSGAERQATFFSMADELLTHWGQTYARSD